MTTSLPGSPARSRTSTYDSRYTPLRDASNTASATSPGSSATSTVSPYNADKKVWGGGYHAKMLERTSSISSSSGGLASRLSSNGLSGTASSGGTPRIGGNRALPTIPSSSALSSSASTPHSSTSPPGSASSTWKPGHRTGSGGVGSFDSIRGRFGNSLQRSDSITSTTPTGSSSHAYRSSGLAPSPMAATAHSPSPSLSRHGAVSVDLGYRASSPSPASPASPPGSFGSTASNRGVYSASSLMRSSTTHGANLHLAAMGDLTQSSIGGVRGLGEFIDSPTGLQRNGSVSGGSTLARRGTHQRAMTMPKLTGLGVESESGIGRGSEYGHGTRNGLDRVSEVSSTFEGSTHPDEIAIPGITTGQVEDVVGMHGRKRLSRYDGGGFGGSGNIGTSASVGHVRTNSLRSPKLGSTGRSLLPSQTLKALETQRHLLQAYEYLCHVGECVHNLPNSSRPKVLLIFFVHRTERNSGSKWFLRLLRTLSTMRQSLPRTTSLPQHTTTPTAHLRTSPKVPALRTRVHQPIPVSKSSPLSRSNKSCGTASCWRSWRGSSTLR